MIDDKKIEEAANLVVKAALGWKEDQRVAKALHVYHRKK